MKKNTYDVLADLLKGIGIISVVMGHSGLLFPANFSSSITAFLYLYHLMIFSLLPECCTVQRSIQIHISISDGS